MTTCTTPPNDRFRPNKTPHRLRGIVRHRARRRKNLAELRALDACRLEDIGLSAAARARWAASGLSTLAAEAPRLNRNLITDAGVCAHGLLAALRSFGLNVRVNARALKDDPTATEALAELDRLEASGLADAEATLAVVHEVLSG